MDELISRSEAVREVMRTACPSSYCVCSVMIADKLRALPTIPVSEAAPATAPLVNVPATPCASCGHNNVDREGVCKQEILHPKHLYGSYPKSYCGHKCVFPEPATTDLIVEDFATAEGFLDAYNAAATTPSARVAAEEIAKKYAHHYWDYDKMVASCEAIILKHCGDSAAAMKAALINKVQDFANRDLLITWDRLIGDLESVTLKER